jgi:hypothetical protein
MSAPGTGQTTSAMQRDCLLSRVQQTRSDHPPIHLFRLVTAISRLSLSTFTAAQSYQLVGLNDARALGQLKTGPRIERWALVSAFGPTDAFTFIGRGWTVVEVYTTADRPRSRDRPQRSAGDRAPVSPACPKPSSR